MQVVHFGAGNIGRGFIGKILAEAGYDIIFVDVNETIINEINVQEHYNVFYAEEEKRSFTVSGVKGLHSVHDEESVIQAITEATLVTTAVGAHILPHVAPVIAKGLIKRVTMTDDPLNVIACENAIGGSDLLKEAIHNHLEEDTTEHIERLIGFPNAAVDRIVPNQSQTNILDVLVEPFFEWVVDKKGIKGQLPPVKDIHFVDQLEAYIERKLFTVNTGHALAAYAGYKAGKKTVQDALNDDTILASIRKGLQETGRLIVEKHGFDASEHNHYIEKILGRFSNPFIIDEVTRVARQPIKKLGYNERLISPVRQLKERNLSADGLIDVIVAALQYDYPEDTEAVELQKKIKEKGVQVAFYEISRLSPEDSITSKVVALYNH
jgi:mannitol-1-phosphate 5-dehydrogenase